jgi:MoaA/NifB/PqqE/SkfB family radical SAM enzyme
VWAGTKEGYAATHPNKGPEDFVKLVRRLDRLARRKREVGSGPRVKLYQVVSRLNAHEFESMADLAERTGSDAVEFTVVDTVPGHTDGLLFSDDVRTSLLDRSLALQRRLEARGEQGRLAGFDTWLRRLGCSEVTQGRGDADIVHALPCTVGWTFLRVMPDGRVCSCLKSHRIPIGDIRKERLPDLWNNERQREFRRRTRVLAKRDPWFANIGNDPGVACGCEKSCDDLGRNQAMDLRLRALSATERALALAAGKVLEACEASTWTGP